MNTRHRRLTSAHAISLVALFVALGGTVYAANSISGTDIQNGTIKATKLKKNTLTGAQINELSLGSVPSAEHADSATNARHADSVAEAEFATQAATATNATKLGGLAAGAYPHGVHLVRKASAATVGTKVVTASCPANEVAIGGGGNNTANTGTVTFDKLQLEPHSFTVIEFELNPGSQGPWVAEAEVACVVAP